MESVFETSTSTQSATVCSRAGKLLTLEREPTAAQRGAQRGAAQRGAAQHAAQRGQAQPHGTRGPQLPHARTDVAASQRRTRHRASSPLPPLAGAVAGAALASAKARQHSTHVTSRAQLPSATHRGSSQKSTHSPHARCSLPSARWQRSEHQPVCRAALGAGDAVAELGVGLGCAMRLLAPALQWLMALLRRSGRSHEAVGQTCCALDRSVWLQVRHSAQTIWGRSPGVARDDQARRLNPALRQAQVTSSRPRHPRPQPVGSPGVQVHVQSRSSKYLRSGAPA